MTRKSWDDCKLPPPAKKPTTKPRRRPTRKTCRKPPGGSLSASILTLATTTPATPPEIAESINTSLQHVHQTLQRYGIQPNTLDSYKIHRADILAGVQERILRTIDDEALKEMPVGQRVMSYGILYDKERLERSGGDDTSRPLVMVIRAEAGSTVAVKVDNNPANNSSTQQVVDITQDGEIEKLT